MSKLTDPSIALLLHELNGRLADRLPETPARDTAKLLRCADAALEVLDGIIASITKGADVAEAERPEDVLPPPRTLADVLERLKAARFAVGELVSTVCGADAPAGDNNDE